MRTRWRRKAQLKAPVPFETLAETTVLPISGEAYIKRRLLGAELAKKGDTLQGLARIHHISGALRAYETTAVFAGGRAEPAGFDVFGKSADRALWIALFAPRAPKPEDQPAVNTAAKAALGGGDTGLPALLSVGVVPAIKAPTLFEQVSAPTPVPVLWEMSSRGRNDFETELPHARRRARHRHQQGPGGGRYIALAIARRESDMGAVERCRRQPARRRRRRAAAAGRSRPRRAPDHLDPPAAETRRAGQSTLAVLAGLERGRDRPACHAERPRARRVHRRIGPGVPAAAPVGRYADLADSGRGTGPRLPAWFRVDDLGAISQDPNVAREAPAYEVDAEAGTVRLGDGVRGRVPEREMRVRLAFGRFGGGRAGNLAAGSVTELAARRIDGRAAPPIKVLQPLALDGGEDAETLTVAEKRIPALLRHRDRAVTEDDYRRLSFEAPSVDVGRVEVLPRFKPRDRRFNVPGVVSVMALPAAPLGPAPNPRPDRPFIERLHAHLSVRTPLATELYVIGCEYIALGLAAAVTLRDGFARDKVLLDVREALRRLLWPLEPGGLDRKGWPLGRAVRSRELEVEVSKVDGVDELRGINLFQHSSGDWQRLPAIAADGAQILSLQPWQLPELLSVIAVDGPAAPTDLRALPNPFAEANAVAVPVVPELC